MQTHCRFGTFDGENQCRIARKTSFYCRIRAFTLVEIMVVVAIVAMLVSLALPGFLRVRKRSQAAAVKNDLRILEIAVDQYAIENRGSGAIPSAADIAIFLKTGTRMHQQSLTGTVTDSLGNPIDLPPKDTPPRIPAATFTSLSDVADASFWAPYSIN